METNALDATVKTFADSRTVIDLDLERLTLFLHLFLFFSRLKRILKRDVVEEREFDFHEGGRAAVGVAGQSRTEFSRSEVIMGTMMMSLMTGTFLRHGPSWNDPVNSQIAIPCVQRSAGYSSSI